MSNAGRRAAVQLLLGLGVGVLQRDPRAELDVRADSFTECGIRRHARLVERGQIELNEALPSLRWASVMCRPRCPRLWEERRRSKSSHRKRRG
jgi:hypothetical protein